MFMDIDFPFFEIASMESMFLSYKYFITILKQTQRSHCNLYRGCQQLADILSVWSDLYTTRVLIQLSLYIRRTFLQLVVTHCVITSIS